MVVLAGDDAKSPIIAFLRSHAQQNGPRIEYYLEPFCGLRKQILFLVRECDVRWNSVEASLLVFYRKMTDLGFTFGGRDVLCVKRENVADE
jgi:hypothetical protein